MSDDDDFPTAHLTLGGPLLGVVGAVVLLAVRRGLLWAAGSVLAGIALSVVVTVASVLWTYVSIAERRDE